MRSWLAVLFVVAFSAAAAAQQAARPLIETSLDRTEAIPGQMMSLRITVLVPTYMPKPPVWPSFEVPNLLVLLPERATNPTSKRIGAETWAGITRNYRISPMLAGQFVLPPQEIIITYADPDTNAPVTVRLATEAMRLAGVIPEIAKGLDPFIAAEALELDQEIAGTPEAMMPGDSVTRTVVASVDGVLPMFLPKLLPETKLDGIAIYPDEPVLAEKFNRGEYGGEREERVTLVAEGGTSGDVPAISLNWYNLKSGRVEIARVDGFAISVDGPPATGSEPPDWRAVILAGLAVGIGLVVAVRVFRWIVPIAVARYRAMREDRLNSEAYAYGRVRRAARSRDYAALLPALDVWAEKVPGPDPRKNPELREAVIAVGAVRYGKIATADGSGSWRKLYNCLADVRRASKTGIHAKAVLPPLNRAA